MSEAPLLSPEPVITAIERGPNATQGGRSCWVYSACGRDPDGYWCDTHQLHFDTKSKCSTHCREPGTHAIALVCKKHGLEAPSRKTS